MNALHGRFALCRWLEEERMWFSNCEDCKQPLKGLEEDQRGLHLLALLNLHVQQQAGCCATGTGENSAQKQLGHLIIFISRHLLMKE